MEREQEYKKKCYEVKQRYREEVLAYGDSEEVRERRREEPAALDRQFWDGEPLTGCSAELR